MVYRERIGGSTITNLALVVCIVVSVFGVVL